MIQQQTLFCCLFKAFAENLQRQFFLIQYKPVNLPEYWT